MDISDSDTESMVIDQLMAGSNAFIGSFTGKKRKDSALSSLAPSGKPGKRAKLEPSISKSRTSLSSQTSSASLKDHRSSLKGAASRSLQTEAGSSRNRGDDASSSSESLPDYSYILATTPVKTTVKTKAKVDAPKQPEYRALGSSTSKAKDTLRRSRKGKERDKVGNKLKKDSPSAIERAETIEISTDDEVHVESPQIQRNALSHRPSRPSYIEKEGFIEIVSSDDDDQPANNASTGKIPMMTKGALSAAHSPSASTAHGECTLASEVESEVLEEFEKVAALLSSPRRDQAASSLALKAPLSDGVVTPALEPHGSSITSALVALDISRERPTRSSLPGVNKKAQGSSFRKAESMKDDLEDDEGTIQTDESEAHIPSEPRRPSLVNESTDDLPTTRNRLRAPRTSSAEQGRVGKVLPSLSSASAASTSGPSTGKSTNAKRVGKKSTGMKLPQKTLAQTTSPSGKTRSQVEVSSDQQVAIYEDGLADSDSAGPTIDIKTASILKHEKQNIPTSSRVTARSVAISQSAARTQASSVQGHERSPPHRSLSPSGPSSPLDAGASTLEDTTSAVDSTEGRAKVTSLLEQERLMGYGRYNPFEEERRPALRPDSTFQDSINRQGRKYINDPMRRCWFKEMISKGTRHEREAPPIDIINDFDEEPCPPFEFVWTNRMLYGEGVPRINRDLKGCDCEDGCDPAKKACACVERQEFYYRKFELDDSGFAYSEHRTLKYHHMPVYECNAACGCPPTCTNRVVQRGRKVKISLRKTKHKGWGVFADQRIPGGTFIGIYAGELLSSKEANPRGEAYDKYGRTYLFDIDCRYLQDGICHEETTNDAGSTNQSGSSHVEYTIDAMHAGNHTRFLNHSCAPNIDLDPIYTYDADHRKPLLCAFTNQDVMPDTELCFSYHGESKSEVETKNLKRFESTVDDHGLCFCGEDECVGFVFVRHGGSQHDEDSEDELML